MADSANKPRRAWAQWILLLVFVFTAFECLLVGVVFKGPWLILAAPGLVCAAKAIEVWRELRRGWTADHSN